MSTFYGGPADGVALSFRLAPPFLRLTFNPHNRKYKWDGLDQPQDTAAPHEVLHAYIRRKEPFVFHMKAGKGMGGWWQDGEYDYLPEQPAEKIMRDNAAWKAWCAAQPLGESRARAIESYIKEELGHPDPLHYCNSYFHWDVSSLAELTETQGVALIERLKVAVPAANAEMTQEKAWREAMEREPVVPAEAHKHFCYSVQGASFKPCRGCGEPITFVQSNAGKKLPVTRAGYSHYLDCPDAKSFSRQNQKMEQTDARLSGG